MAIKAIIEAVGGVVSKMKLVYLTEQETGEYWFVGTEVCEVEPGKAKAEEESLTITARSAVVRAKLARAQTTTKVEP